MPRPTLLILATLTLLAASPRAACSQRYPVEAGMRVLEVSGLSGLIGMRPDEVSAHYDVRRFKDGFASLTVGDLEVEAQFDSVRVGPAMSIRLSEDSRVSRVMLAFPRSDLAPLLESLTEVIGSPPDECYRRGGRYIRQVGHRWLDEGVLLMRHEQGYEGQPMEATLRVFVGPPRSTGEVSGAQPCSADR